MNGERRTVAEVLRLQQARGGDPVTEELILRFIGACCGAQNLFSQPAKVAAEAVRRPGASMKDLDIDHSSLPRHRFGAPPFASIRVKLPVWRAILDL